MKRALILIIIGAVIARHCAADDEAPAAEEATPTVVTVQTNALTIATLHRYVQGYGTVEPAPATTNAPSAGAWLSAPAAGVVTRVVVFEGQHVEKGDLLVELNSGTMTVENARQEVERQRQLYAQQNTSLKNLQSAEAQLALLQVTAPLSGTVARINVKPGQAVDLTMVVAVVIDLNRLAVSAEIPATEADAVETGAELQVLTDPPVAGTISFISPDVDTNNGAVLVRALLPPGGRLRPGRFVPLRIVTAVHTNCLAAPAESVVRDDQGNPVIAIVKGDEAVQHVVKPGLREDGLVEIEGEGLKAGDTVVTVGAYGLPPKTKVRVANPPK